MSATEARTGSILDHELVLEQIHRGRRVQIITQHSRSIPELLKRLEALAMLRADPVTICRWNGGESIRHVSGGQVELGCVARSDHYRLRGMVLDTIVVERDAVHASGLSYPAAMVVLVDSVL